MRSRTRAFTTRISTAAARPRPPARGSSRCDTTPRNVAASVDRGLTLAVRWEELHEPVDAVGRSDGRHRRDHQVADLRGLEHRAPRGIVGQLAEDEHVRVLTQRVLESRDGGGCVGTHLTLVDDRALVGVEHLDRVLDGDDVTLAVLVHVVDHRRDGGGLARAGEAGDQHQTVLLACEVGDGRGEPERLEARDAGQDPAEHHAHVPALAERAHPEAAEPGDPVHEVTFVLGGEPLGPRPRDHRRREPLGVVGLDGVERALPEAAVDAQARA